MDTFADTLLAYDSDLDDSGVRGHGTSRQLSFRTNGAVIDLELEVLPGGVSVLGQLVPAGPGTVRVLLAAGGHIDAVSDSTGYFRVDGLPLEALALIALDRGVRTGWLVPSAA